jgi:hypothetical protein
MWLWFLVFVAIAVYAADTFTAVKLLGFNEWSGQVKPSIPFAISKWIFAVCILLSWTILIFEWIRALRVISRGSVADDYLDELAVKLQSMRFGTGWRRFLVFAELTKTKKKVTWIALFVYFQRKGKSNSTNVGNQVANSHRFNSTLSRRWAATSRQCSHHILCRQGQTSPGWLQCSEPWPVGFCSILR